MSRRPSGRFVLRTVLMLATALAWTPGALVAQAPPRPPTTPAPRGTAPAKPAAKPTARPGNSRPASASPQRSIVEAAREAREIDDIGAYARALAALRALRARVPADGDLELAIALNEARTGAVDSAMARLARPVLAAAAEDSLPESRRREYPYQREGAWINGRFDGWHWYVWRARAEVAAARGNWPAAQEAAERSVAAHPNSGKDHLILAVCAGKAGDANIARAAAARAMDLDPTLPEAHYLDGLWAWRSGQRATAVRRFRSAVGLDSTYRPAALALVRASLPGASPDTLPAELLTGIRRIALLTSAERPKPEEFAQMDVPASLESAPDSAVVDTLIPGTKPVRLTISVLVDEKGRAVLTDVPWFPPGALDFAKVTRILRSVPAWRFHPAVRLGAPNRVWVSLEYYLNP